MPTSCPICEGELAVTGLHCRSCETTIEGRFSPGPFAELTAEQQGFVEAFVRCEGKFTRLEGELGMSYPTLRGRLHDVIRAMGYEPGADQAPGLSQADRHRILEDLDEGRIDAETAMRLLRGEEVPGLAGDDVLGEGGES
jgi:hypothetical protein